MKNIGFGLLTACGITTPTTVNDIQCQLFNVGGNFKWCPVPCTTPSREPVTRKAEEAIWKQGTNAERQYLKQKWPEAIICPKLCGSGSQIWSKCLWTSVTFALKLVKDSFTLKYGRFNSMKWQFALRGKNEGRYVYAICPCWCWLSCPSNFAHNVHRICKTHLYIWTYFLSNK